MKKAIQHRTHGLLRVLVTLGLRRLMRGGSGATMWLPHPAGEEGLMQVRVKTRWKVPQEFEIPGTGIGR